MSNETQTTSDTNVTSPDTGADGKGEGQRLPASVSGVPLRQTHDRPPDMVMKIDRTTYRVWAHFSQTSKETLNDKIKRMLREDVQRMMTSQ
ncbi:MAG: transposon-encoded TnpW family protein [Oscillibacter sp.]|nr:transposon-encoded TnpW family protein [Oscillibacter sp.]